MIVVLTSEVVTSEIVKLMLSLYASIYLQIFFYLDAQGSRTNLTRRD